MLRVDQKSKQAINISYLDYSKLLVIMYDCLFLKNLFLIKLKRILMYQFFRFGTSETIVSKFWSYI
jgi:hypothetical protein